MAAYAYAIQVKPDHQTIIFEESKTIENDALYLADLAFIGADMFSIHERDWRDGGGYLISVRRSRLETDQERDDRVTRERAYMAEFLRRNPTKA